MEWRPVRVRLVMVLHDLLLHDLRAADVSTATHVSLTKRSQKCNAKIIYSCSRFL